MLIVHWEMLYKHHDMVLISDGDSEISAHVWSNLYHLICLSHFIRSRAVKNTIFCSEKTFSFMRAQHVLISHLIQVPCTTQYFFITTKKESKETYMTYCMSQKSCPFLYSENMYYGLLGQTVRSEKNKTGSKRVLQIYKLNSFKLDMFFLFLFYNQKHPSKLHSTKLIHGHPSPSLLLPHNHYLSPSLSPSHSLSFPLPFLSSSSFFLSLLYINNFYSPEV